MSDSWKNNFCRHQQWSRAHLHTKMVVTSLHISTLKFIRKRLLLQTFSEIRRTFIKKFSSDKSWRGFEISFSTNYAQIFQEGARNSSGAPGFCTMSPCWPSAPGCKHVQLLREQYLNSIYQFPFTYSVSVQHNSYLALAFQQAWILTSTGKRLMGCHISVLVWLLAAVQIELRISGK